MWDASRLTLYLVCFTVGKVLERVSKKMPNSAYHFTLFGRQYYFTTRFAALTFLIILVFIYLCHAEINQAQKKHELLKMYAARTNSKAITVTDLQKSTSDLRFYTAELQGFFDNNHTLLLDNQKNLGQSGYEVFTPFKPNGSSTSILIDRGFVPGTGNPNTLPKIAITNQSVVISGMLDIPSAYLGSGALYDETTAQWPIIVIQHLDFEAITKLIGYPLFPYLVLLDPQNPYGFTKDWKGLHENPEKNRERALLWFLAIICTIILFIVLNIHRVKNTV